MHRRAFLQWSGTLASGALGTLALPASMRAALAEPIDLDLPSPTSDVAGDEAYWARVRKLYAVDPSILDLDHGNCGLTPRRVLEQYMRNARLMNSAPNVHIPRLVRDNSMYETINAFLGVQAPDDVALVPNATQALNTVLRGFPLDRGDEVLVSNHEYPDMVATLHARAKREGIVVRTVNVPERDADSAAFVHALEVAVTARTKLALLSHVSAWNGEVLPIADACAALRARNVATCVDAAQSAGFLDVNFGALGCDFLALSWHKGMCAPIATGALAMRQQWFGVVEPLHPPTWDVSKYPIEMYAWTGTANFAGYAAIPTAISVQRQIGIANKHARLRYLAEYWQSRLAAIPRIRLLTPSSPARTMGFAAFAVAGMPSKTVADQLRERHRVNVQSKAERPYKPFPESVRVTPQPYTTLRELDRFVGAVISLATA
ncbi:MAG: aminotransferase class V-fold PLP-dependent enzyme [Gemmatimonadaceae bacterium]